MAARFEFGENKLHEIWRGQGIAAPYLRTDDGRALEIINPGRYNSDSGPDFRRATIRFQGKLVEGDVECHLHATDWEAHGHQRDPAYNEVILHVALASDAPPHAIVRENGLTIPQLFLPENFVRAFTLEATPPLSCPLSQTSPEKIFATALHAGALRLETKAAAFAEQVQHCSWDQAVYRGLAEALGYEKNQAPFRKLAELLPIDLLFAELRGAREYDPEVLLEALLFGASGFLAQAGVAPESEVAAFIVPRERIWEGLRHTLQLRPLRTEEWIFFRLRPANFPTRRLAALCQLILKFYRGGILEHLAATVQALGSEPNRLMPELLQYFICPAQGFWQTHYDLRERQAAKPAVIGDVLGRERALDILVNLILPALWFYFRSAENAVLANQVHEAYSLLPKLQDNAMTRAMREQLSREFSVSTKLSRSARLQQGLLYLQKLFCRPLRCEACLQLEERSVSQMIV